MSFLFGFVFLLFGLALAVLAGIVLYRDPQKDTQAAGTILKAVEEPKAI